MSSTNHWKLGLFVVTGIGLSLGTLALLGAKQFEREVNEFHVFFDEPVDGLTIGSDVRFRGISIGLVRGITVAPDRQHVHVRTEIFVDTLERLGLRERGGIPTDPKLLNESGLRAQLERNALTGMAVINANYFDPNRYPGKEFSFPTPPFTLLTAPSSFKGLIADVAVTLEKLPDLLDNMDSLVSRIDRSLSELEIPKIASSVRSAADRFRTAIDTLEPEQLSADVRKTLEEARRTLRTYDGLAREVGQEVKRADVANLGATTREALESVENAGDAMTSLMNDARGELRELQSAVHAFRDLVRMLERDPGALIHGKTPARARREAGK